MSRLGLGLMVAVLAVVAIAAYAVGAGKSSSDVTLCAVKKSGDLSLASNGKCGKGEKKLTIAKQGPVGPQGGVGPAGSAANVVAEPVHYVATPPTPECPAKPGTFCKATNQSGGWLNVEEVFGGGYEKVGYYKDPSGIVHLVGLADYSSSGGSAGGFVPEGPFYLPVGYRPSHTEVFKVASGSGLLDSSTVEVRPSGLVAAEETDLNLSGITFRP